MKSRPIASHRVADWRALDDSVFEFPAECEQLIRCDGAKGMTAREIGQLARWLAGPAAVGV